MLGMKLLIYTGIFLVCSAIGLIKSQKYTWRVEELKEFKNALNMFKTKISFTFEPIPDIFAQISGSVSQNISSIFRIASYNMQFFPAGDAWSKAMDADILNIKAEDKKILKDLSKLLGKTDLNGQISQIEITSSFLDEQIKKAEKEREKSEGMYRKLGMIIGLGIIIILIWIHKKGNV